MTFAIALVMNYSCSYKFIIHHEMSSVPLDISPVYAEKHLFQKVRTSLIMLLKTSFSTLQQTGTFLHPDILKTVVMESSLRFFGKVCVRGDVFWTCLSGERLFQRGEVWSGCRVLQQRHGGGQHERPAACQQSHGLPQAREVGVTFIPSACVCVCW